MSLTMTLENERAFISRIKADAYFRKKVLECKSPDERNFYVLKEGFELEAKELELVKDELFHNDVEGSAGWGVDWHELL